MATPNYAPTLFWQGIFFGEWFSVGDGGLGGPESPPGRPLKWDSSMLMAPLLRLDEKIGRTFGLRDRAKSGMKGVLLGPGGTGGRRKIMN